MIDWRAAHPLVMFAGLAVAYWALKKRRQDSGLTSEEQAFLGVAAFLGGMFGSKVPFWIASIQQTDSAVASPLFWIADGKTILGGIFGGYVAVELTKLTLGITRRTGDQFAVPVAIAVSAGRIGCFLAGCCFGSVADLPWSCTFETAGDSLPRHPTQLYEFAFHASAVGWLYVSEQRGWLKERRLVVYLLAYLAYRFVTEWIRPEVVIAAGLTAYQVACVALAVLLIVLDRFASRRSRTAALADSTDARN